ncbi:hypothetical protein [Burkholderia sp. Ac-20392]|uniref:hypothetical protein n=1 Tax=Burkholderia sp. Ac-20392 TaxID=2703905 RepID=UPI001981768C|nr:hypothetical protein [Burkholderia sp. Ac-20392]MBN3793462.1 hypothetical protein [Burkholderia sp. Ac-20392]
MMASIEINSRVFEEVVAFMHLCGAFASLHPSTARQYECVRNDRVESTMCLRPMRPGTSDLHGVADVVRRSGHLRAMRAGLMFDANEGLLLISLLLRRIAFTVAIRTYLK